MRGAGAAVLCASLLGLLGWFGCGKHDEPKSEPTDSGTDTAMACEAGFDPGGEQCVPRFDRCDDHSVPKLGGGCTPVGVPPDGCGAGFSSDGHGGCEVKLPDSCPAGMIALPGDATCSPIASCGSGTWGDIPIDATTVYVDASYSGTDGDGSKDKPFPTLGPAIAAAKDGALLALAAGTYVGNFYIFKSLRIWGRCPSMVTIQGDPKEDARETIHAQGAKVELHRLAITGPYQGVYFANAKGFVVEDVWVHDALAAGIQIQATSNATDGEVRRVVIERGGVYGIFVIGSTVTIDRVNVRDTRGGDSPDDGVGILSLIDGSVLVRTDLKVRGSVIERSRSTGMLMQGTAALVEDTVIRDTGSTSNAGTQGAGLVVIADTDRRVNSILELRRSLLDRNGTVGIGIDGSIATIERTVVRRTLPRAADKASGRGLQLGRDTNLTFRDSLVEESHEAGVLLFSATAVFERAIVRDTLEDAKTRRFGIGIGALDNDPPSTLVLRDTLVTRSRYVGVLIHGSKATLQRVAVLDTKPQLSDGKFGDGVVVAVPVTPPDRANVSLEACVVRDSGRAGLLVVGSDASLSNSALTCNVYDLDSEILGAEEARLRDLGGNACGCGADGRSPADGVATACAGVSRDLEAVKVPVGPK